MDFNYLRLFERGGVQWPADVFEEFQRIKSYPQVLCFILHSLQQARKFIVYDTLAQSNIIVSSSRYQKELSFARYLRPDILKS